MTSIDLDKEIPEDFLTEVAEGNIAGHSLFTVSGRNPDVDTTVADIGVADIIFPWRTVATTVEGISDNVNDTVAGTGARVITITGLDENFNEVIEDLDMNGTSATASTVATFIRVNLTVVKSAGLYSTSLEGSNIGTVVVRPTGGGTRLSNIDGNLIDPGKSQDFKYTVPVGFRAMILSAAANIEGSKLARIVLTTRPDADIIVAPFSSKVSTGFIAGASGLHVLPKEILNVLLPAKTDLWASAIADANNTEVSVVARLLIIKDGF